MPARQAKCWPFTWYPANPAIYGDLSGRPNAAIKFLALDELQKLRALSECTHVQYVVAQAELCPTTTRLHLQGYVEVKERWTWHRVKEHVFDACGLVNASVQAARGTPLENKRYCTKEESRVPGTEPFEAGLMSNEDDGPHAKGKSLDRLFADIKSGLSMEDLIDKFGFGVYVRHERAIKSAMCTWGARRKAMPEIILLVGPSGSGKSRWVERKYPDRYRMTFGNGGNSAWFDGYNGENVIELSEFRGQLQLAFMLDLLDRYQLKVQTKGGTVQFLASTIVITSNEEPSEWYKALDDRDSKLKPLLRRIEEFGTRPRYMSDNRADVTE